MSLPITQLRVYYDALCALKEEEQTALAKFHVDDPQFLLAHRFKESLKTLEHRSPIDDRYYSTRRTDPCSRRTDCNQITKTIHFAGQLCARDKCTVGEADELSFRYVDRELFPLRTTASDGQAPRRWLDLLLANWHDQTPVFAELKIGTDKHAYFALVQTLMLAVEFLIPESQRDRLSAHPPAKDLLALPEQGPFADIYVILFQPATSDNRRRSLEATERIAQRLVEHDAFSEYIRRIACIEAFCRDDTLAFRKLFAFGPGVSTL